VLFAQLRAAAEQLDDAPVLGHGFSGVAVAEQT
jgi:hypothetical protein